MSATPWSRIPSAAAAELDGGRRAAAGATLLLVVGGIVLAALGSASGALVICLGLAVSGIVDRRLPVLGAVALLPTLTVFHPLVLTYVGRSALDLRLLLTAGTGLAIAPWVLVGRRRPDLVGWLLIAFVGVLAVLSLGNAVSPMHALPVLGRWGTYTIVYLAARTWLGRAGDTRLVIGAVVVGMVVPALSGLLQMFVGDALLINDAARLSGVYATSPVGLGLAMQLAALALAGVIAVRLGPSGRSRNLVVGLLVVFSIVLIGTATRLVFASFVVGLLLTAGLARRYLAMPVIVLGAVLVLLSQPALAGRFASTVEAQPTIPPSGELGSPTDPADPRDVVVGDASLRFRLYVWGSMVPEWLSSPLIGHGTGSFATIFERRSGLARVAPHNDYLGIAVEDGVVGLIAYLALQAAVVSGLARRLWRQRPARPSVPVLVALVAFVSLNVINSINNPILFVDLQVALWAIVGSSLAQPDGAGSPTALVSPVDGGRPVPSGSTR